MKAFVHRTSGKKLFWEYFEGVGDGSGDFDNDFGVKNLSMENGLRRRSRLSTFLVRYLSVSVFETFFKRRSRDGTLDIIIILIRSKWDLTLRKCLTMSVKISYVRFVAKF
jgi:hypothetical protein